MDDEILKGRIEFQFEYLAMLSAESLHTILMNVELHNLTVAMKDIYACRALSRVLNECLSPEALEQLKKDMLSLGSVSVSEVRRQQWNIVAVVRNLALLESITVPGCFYFPSDADIAQYCEFLSSGKTVRRSFKMEDIARLDDRSIQHLLFCVEEDDLVKALVYASPKARQCVFRNMTREAVSQLEKKILAGHASTTEEIVASLKAVVRSADRLAEEGNLHYVDEMIGSAGNLGF